MASCFFPPRTQIMSKARLVSESGKVQIALRAASACLAASSILGLDRPVTLQHVEDLFMADAQKGALVQYDLNGFAFGRRATLQARGSPPW